MTIFINHLIQHQSATMVNHILHRRYQVRFPLFLSGNICNWHLNVLANDAASLSRLLANAVTISSPTIDDNHRLPVINQNRSIQSTSTILSLSQEPTSNDSLNNIIEGSSGSSIPIQLTPKDPDSKQLLFWRFEILLLRSLTNVKHFSNDKRITWLDGSFWKQ